MSNPPWHRVPTFDELVGVIERGAGTFKHVRFKNLDKINSPALQQIIGNSRYLQMMAERESFNSLKEATITHWSHLMDLPKDTVAAMHGAGIGGPGPGPGPGPDAAGAGGGGDPMDVDFGHAAPGGGTGASGSGGPTPPGARGHRFSAPPEARREVPLFEFGGHGRPMDETRPPPGEGASPAFLSGIQGTLRNMIHGLNVMDERQAHLASKADLERLHQATAAQAAQYASAHAQGVHLMHSQNQDITQKLIQEIHEQRIARGGLAEEMRQLKEAFKAGVGNVSDLVQAFRERAQDQGDLGVGVNTLLQAMEQQRALNVHLVHGIGEQLRRDMHHSREARKEDLLQLQQFLAQTLTQFAGVNTSAANTAEATGMQQRHQQELEALRKQIEEQKRRVDEQGAARAQAERAHKEAQAKEYEVFASQMEQGRRENSALRRQVQETEAKAKREASLYEKHRQAMQAENERLGKEYVGAQTQLDAVINAMKMQSAAGVESWSQQQKEARQQARAPPDEVPVQEELRRAAPANTVERSRSRGPKGPPPAAASTALLTGTSALSASAGLSQVNSTGAYPEEFSIATPRAETGLSRPAPTKRDIEKFLFNSHSAKYQRLDPELNGGLARAALRLHRMRAQSVPPEHQTAGQIEVEIVQQETAAAASRQSRSPSAAPARMRAQSVAPKVRVKLRNPLLVPQVVPSRQSSVYPGSAAETAAGRVPSDLRPRRNTKVPISHQVEDAAELAEEVYGRHRGRLPRDHRL